MKKALALVDALAVFAAALAAVALVARSPLAQWERVHVLRPFAEYFALGLVPLAVLMLARLPLPFWGIRPQDLGSQLDASLKCLLPFAAGKALAYTLGPRQAVHSIAEPLIALGVLAACAWLLRPRASLPPLAALAVVFALSRVSPLQAVSALVFYPLFLGPAEELLFRGYIQSRLNRAFGRPFRLAGASCGAGLLGAALLFSAFHVLNLPALFAGRLDPAWETGVPTLARGLVLGYLRERTDSLLPPAVVHGVPQALAWAFLGR